MHENIETKMIETQEIAEIKTPENNLVIEGVEQVPLFKHKKDTHFLFRLFWFFFFLSLIVVTFYFFNRNKIQPERVILTEASLSSSLEITGKVVPKESATLSFERMGVVSSVSVKEGDFVKENQNLLTLFATDLTSTKLVAEAGFAKARADLSNLKRGASSEQIAFKEQVILDNGEVLKASLENLLEVIKTTNATLDKEIRGNLSSLFIYQVGDTYKVSFTSCDQVGSGILEGKRSLEQKQLINLADKVSSLSNLSSREEIASLFKTTINTVNASKIFVTDTQDFLNNNCNGKDTSLATLRTTVAMSFASLSALSSDLQVKNSSLILQKNALEQAKKDLLVLRAGANVDQRDSLLALVSQAKASILSVKNEEAKTKINAPFDGIISKVYLSKGENAQLGVPAVTLLSMDGYQVEGYVREIDVTSLRYGNEVSITLDAFPKGSSFKGVVSRIDPSPVVQGGVPLYKIVVSFVSQDERIRDGMSAKLTMILYKNANAIVISPRFVRFASNGKVFIKFVNGENVFEKEVLVGNRGDDGQIEITEGAQKGDVVEIMDTVPRGAQKGVSGGIKTYKI